jgi:hypothetical protein
MRFMLLLKADRNTEAGVMPSKELMVAMGRYNEEMVKAGVMLAGEGLQPSGRGARVMLSGDERRVQHGPFVDTRGLVAGFWMIQVSSLDEAIAWVKRCPNPLDGEAEIEIRQVFEASDFPPEVFSAEDAAREDALRAEMRRRSATP